MRWAFWRAGRSDRTRPPPRSWQERSRRLFARERRMPLGRRGLCHSALLPPPFLAGLELGLNADSVSLNRCVSPFMGRIDGYSHAVHLTCNVACFAGVGKYLTTRGWLRMRLCRQQRSVVRLHAIMPVTSELPTPKYLLISCKIVGCECSGCGNPYGCNRGRFDLCWCGVCGRSSPSPIPATKRRRSA